MDRASMSRRVWALAILVPIACGWGWFVSSTPIFRWNIQRSHDASRVVLGDYLFDFSSQTATSFVNDGTAASLLPNDNGLSFLATLKNRSAQNTGTTTAFRLTVFDHHERRMVHDIDLVIDNRSFPIFINERLIVVQKPNGLQWLDLSQGTDKWQELTTRMNKVLGVSTHQKQPVFSCTFQDVATPMQNTTELFRFSEEGELRLLASWKHLESATPGHYDTKLSGDCIFSIDVSGAYLESRSVLDGTLIDSILLEQPIARFAFSYWDDCLHDIGNQPSLYSLSGKRIPIPYAGWQSNTFYSKLSPDAKTRLWSDSERTLITETELGRTVCEIKEPGFQYVFLDPKTLISWGNGWGLTLRQHDLQTGETLVRWHPFWWVWPCLAVLSIATLCWALMWIQIPKHGAAWGWCDFYILMSLCMILLVTRVLVVGNFVTASRLSFVYAQAVCASGIFIAWYMLFFSAQRWIVRLMHLLATYFIVLLSTVIVFHERSLEACAQLILVSIPALMALPLFALIALYPMRSKRARDAQSAAATRSHVIKLRDLFWLMAFVALVLVTIKPLLPGMGAWLQLPWMLILLAWVTLFAWAGVAAALARSKRWRRVGAILVAAAFCLLAFDIGMICMAGEQWQTSYFDWQHEIIYLFRGCLSALVVSFFLARCLNVVTGCQPVTSTAEL
jgi:hypothetical protein